VSNTQYIWGADGNIILRDRNADGSSGSDYGQTGSGLEERIYAIHGPDGDVTGITDATGEILERFVYDPLGNFQVLTPLGVKIAIDTDLGIGDDGLGNYFDRPEHNFVGLSDDNLGGTAYGWRFFQHGQYFDRVSGLYRDNSGTARNPRTDQTLVPNSLANVMAGNAYQFKLFEQKAEQSDRLRLTIAAMTVGVAASILTGGLASAYFLGGGPSLKPQHEPARAS
jgi:YD repeat-containing protein